MLLFLRFPCESLAQNAYLIADGGEAVVVDPLRDADELLAVAAARGLRVRAAIATHVHADFVAGLHEVAAATGAAIALGERFAGRLGGDRLADGQVLRLGEARLQVIATPGHTPESVCLLAEAPGAPARLLSGDTLFVGDVGRPDLAPGVAPRAMAEQLFASLRDRIGALSDEVEVWPAHGAGSACGACIATATSSTLRAERLGNWALREADRERFCARLLGGRRPPPPHFAAIAAANRDGPPLVRSLPALAPLSLAAATEAIRAGAVVLDVRSWRDHGRGHWPGALNLALDGGEFEPWAGALLPAAADVVLHAADGPQAALAARRLRRVGRDLLRGFVTEPPAAPATVPQIDAVDVFAGGGEPWQVIDVRRPDEFTAGHVPGAVPCELGPAMPAAGLARLDRCRRTAVFCEGGYRSSAALGQLRALGFVALHNVADGMRGWRGNHLPQQRGGPTATSG